MVIKGTTRDSLSGWSIFFLSIPLKIGLTGSIDDIYRSYIPQIGFDINIQHWWLKQKQKCQLQVSSRPIIKTSKNLLCLGEMMVVIRIQNLKVKSYHFVVGITVGILWGKAWSCRISLLQLKWVAMSLFLRTFPPLRILKIPLLRYKLLLKSNG